ncbi:hypothetical protein L208DRAFT_573019 [Tricholoma matsutake]|nr:hypothetical protein L208DRAFT_573019 [Tricholoma matsutake 945]
MWFSVRLLHIYPLPRLLIFCWQDDHHPDWPATDCPYGGHAMTIIGYGLFKKGGKGKDRLYWIVQNRQVSLVRAPYADIDIFCSWGISKGKLGYVYSMYYLFPLTKIYISNTVAAGSLGQAAETAYGVKVNERVTHTEV